MNEENSRGLDFSGGDSGLLVVCGKLGCLSGNALKDVCLTLLDVHRTGGSGGELTIDEGVEDGHGTVGDTSVGVDLLQDCQVC